MKRGKKAQFEISFNMIFSIILIIVFVVVAFYAIRFFLDLKKCSDTGLFKSELQEIVTKAWNSDMSNPSYSSTLPDNLNYLCFADLSKPQKGQYTSIYTELKKLGFVNMNMFFSPTKNTCKGQAAFKIEHLNITSKIISQNPYCIKINSGKISIQFEKDYYESMVKIK